MKKNITFLFFILSILPVLAQKGADRGKITDVVEGSGGGNFLTIVFFVVILLAFVVGIIRSIFTPKK